MERQPADTKLLHRAWCMSPMTRQQRAVPVVGGRAGGRAAMQSEAVQVHDAVCTASQRQRKLKFRCFKLGQLL